MSAFTQTLAQNVTSKAVFASDVVLTETVGPHFTLNEDPTKTCCPQLHSDWTSARELAQGLTSDEYLSNTLAWSIHPVVYLRII